MKRVIFNQKGGVGKSTITCNLAAVAAVRGHRCLVIDLDAQGNSTQYLLGSGAATAGPSLVDMFEQALQFKLVVKKTREFIRETPFENLHLLASHPGLVELAGKLESRHKIFKFRDALAELNEDFDMIFIDTPPALNFFTLSALIAADTCLIPFDCDEFARRALYTLIDNVAEIRADHNARLEVEGVVINQFQPRANLPQKLVDELISEGLPVLTTCLSSSIKIKESHEQSLPMIHLAPSHKLSLEYEALFDELEKGRRKLAKGRR